MCSLWATLCILLHIPAIIFANDGQHGCLSYQFTILSYVALQMALEIYLSIQYVDSSVKTQDNNQQLSSRLGFVCLFSFKQTKIWVLLEIQSIDLVIIHTIHHHISIMDNNDQLKTTAAASH